MAILGLLNISIFLFCGFQASGNEKLPQEFFAMRSALCDKPAILLKSVAKFAPNLWPRALKGF